MYIYIYIPIHENTRAFFKGGYFPKSHNPQVWSVSFKQPRSGLGDMILLMGSEILHRLRLVVYPIIYGVSYIQTVVVWDFWTINSMVVEYDQKPYHSTQHPQGGPLRPYDFFSRVTGAPRSRVFVHPSLPRFFSAIYRGPVKNPSYNDRLGAHLVRT